ncbi:hypothetical protein [Agrobacterium sp. P15N1-A]|uniref:hypothetical protein n=1 Tax=Agrobacterium sp. P15N1-A TaxID=3342820 RepID=UPI0037D87618
MIRAGCRIGVCQTPLVRDDPDVVRLLADDFELPLDTWIVMHEDLRGHRAAGPPSMRSVADCRRISGRDDKLKIGC